MIVGDLDSVRLAVNPAKANSPLVVDADAVLSVAIACKFLQSIPRRHAQIIQRFGRIENRQLTQCGALQFSGEPLDPFTPEESLRGFVREIPDHDVMIAPRVINVKRRVPCFRGSCAEPEKRRVSWRKHESLAGSACSRGRGRRGPALARPESRAPGGYKFRLGFVVSALAEVPENVTMLGPIVR